MAEENLETPQQDFKPANQRVTWTASEFIAHEKSANWYLMLAGVAVLLAGLLFILTKDAVPAASVITGAVFLGIFAARQPRQLGYAIDRHGIQVGAKTYGFENFKSFSVVQETSFGGINFMPLKRFAPMLTIYYSLEQEQQILDLLQAYLPFEEAKPDRVESLMRRIRF